MKKYLSLVLALWLMTFPQSWASPDAEMITIDANAATTIFPHFWEQMFGSGRAVLSLRQAYCNDLTLLKSITDCQYIRFHGIFNDEIGVFDTDSQHNDCLNFTYVDQIYDGLLAKGVKPFVELSFMPAKLASANTIHSFWYHPNVSEPKDYNQWSKFIRDFTQHLVKRYGIKEVATWYFEVWNEPNLDFWQPDSGEHKKTYFQLYAATANAIESVDAQLKVGGPATAQAAWINDFIDFCVTNKIKVDFLSTHVYANDSNLDVFGKGSAPIPRADFVGKAVNKVYDEVKASKMPNLPIIWSEYNASYLNEVEVTDSSFMGPWLANTIKQCNGLVTQMSLWTFSDVFEEQGVPKSPFYGGYGLIANYNIPKASFNALALLHKLGEYYIPLASPMALATKRKDNAIVVAVWNYVDPHELGTPKTITVKFSNLNNLSKAKVYVLDDDHGCALTIWKKMGKPQFPTTEQLAKLKSATLNFDIQEFKLNKSQALKLQLQPRALALIEVLPKTAD